MQRCVVAELAGRRGPHHGGGVGPRGAGGRRGRDPGTAAGCVGGDVDVGGVGSVDTFAGDVGRHGQELSLHGVQTHVQGSKQVVGLGDDLLLGVQHFC